MERFSRIGKLGRQTKQITVHLDKELYAKLVQRLDSRDGDAQINSIPLLCREIIKNSFARLEEPEEPRNEFFALNSNSGESCIVESIDKAILALAPDYAESGIRSGLIDSTDAIGVVTHRPRAVNKKDGTVEIEWRDV